ncbi:glycosyltransferase family 2 protein [Elusimicrobiota bacterium]
MNKYSVIIPSYNRKLFLGKAVETVLSQSYAEFEIIIIDDGSTDGTKELLEKYEDERIRYIYQDNRGVSSARNRGLKEAQGEYIAFLDSDDWWHRDKLTETDLAVEDNPEYLIFHTQEKWYRNGKVLNQKKIHEKPSGYIFENCLKLCSVSISTAAVKREIFEDIGSFAEDLPVCEDYDLWIRISAKYPVYLIDKVLTLKEGGHKDQLSRKYPGMDKFRIKAICRLMDSGTLDKEQYKIAFEELSRKCKIYSEGCIKRGKQTEGSRYAGIIEKYKKTGVTVNEK